MLPPLFRRLLPIVLAVLVMGAGWVVFHNSKKEFTVATNQTVLTASPTSGADETVPQTDSYVWKGASNDPKYLRIPALHINAFVQNVGIDQYHQIVAPNNIHIAGWFTESVRPGSAGLSIIDGHLDGAQSAGIFASLSSITTGTKYELELGNGTLLHYTVLSVQTVGLDEAANILFSQDPAVKNQLNLITCGGPFDQKTHSYIQRVVVASAQL